MKNLNKIILLFAISLMMIGTAHSQGTGILEITFGPNYPAATGLQSMDVFMKAGPGYVQDNSQYGGTNFNGSWESLNLRFTSSVVPALVLTNFTVTYPTVGFGGGQVTSLPSGSPCAYSAAFNISITRNTPAVDAGTVPVRIATLTFPAGGTGNFTIRNTTTNTACQPRETFWSNSSPTNSGIRLTVAGNLSVLPITVSSFTGTAVGCTANLSWTILNDSKNSYYAVESSIDGLSFTQVGKVIGKNSIVGQSYNFSSTLASSNTYFRLKLVNLDDEFTYSSVVKIKGTGACSASVNVSVYPNPTTDMINVYGIASGSRVQLVDINGKVITEVVTVSSNQKLDMSRYTSGVYIMRVQATDGTINHIRVVKL